MTSEIISATEVNMKKTLEVVKKEFSSLRAGRATPDLLNKIMVNYYGTLTPVSQMANISAPEARLLLIQPWDKSTLPEIEKAIMKSDLGLSPSSDGTVVRLSIPQLTEDRRKELVKASKKKSEEGRVAIRNIRRDANDNLKDLEKNGEIREDELHRSQDEIQKLTDKYIKEIDLVTAKKEQEIMQV
ncbi:MAG: ribosome recycling factor [Peptococcaceae bacterium]|nr:ribosome recycling factor [Peptococcaceae bacterium]